MLSVAQLLQRILQVLEDQGGTARGCGRPLGPDNLLTLAEVARELGCRDARARELLAAVPPITTPGVGKRWRWGDVLQACEDAGGRAAVSRTRRVSPTRLPQPARV